MKIKDIPKARKALIRWYLNHHRPLPWRATDNPYHIWVSEVMLQQTQVATVIDYYHAFLKRFPTLKKLARADGLSVLKVWEGLGYYARARNLHRAAQIVLSEYGGEVPCRKKDFLGLPGVGEYIASAVMSIAFKQVHAVVDGNVKRVLARLFMIDAPVNRGGSNRIFKERADQLIDARSPGISNQAIMELGAVVCRPRNPDCGRCPVSRCCRACQTRHVDGYPKAAPRKKIPEHHVAVGVVFKKGRVLITQRSAHGLLGGLWEFPGGKVRPGETPQQACAREIKEEVGIGVKIETFITRVKHAYTHFKIVMDVYQCRYVSGRVGLSGPVDFRWIKPEEIDNYPLPKANHKFLSYIR